MRNKIFTKKLIGVWIVCIATSLACYSQTINWKLVTPKYPTADAFVSAINVMDEGADPTGNTDQTKLFQNCLDVLGSRTNNTGRLPDGTPNGGVLYLPEGKYLIQGTLFVPKGVTIRGDWEKPVKGQPIKGTILVSDNPDAKGRDGSITIYEGLSMIIMQPSSAIRDIAIWYPEQDPSNIVPYPPAILFGQQGYWGNDYVLASNITLVNAFDGVIFSRRNGGGAPNYYGIYGTPLRRGIEVDNIAEVGRIDNVDFSPDYWAGSGLPGSPSVDGPHKQYIRNNGTAVVMRRNDWSFIGKVKAEGYNIGYRLDWSYNNDTNTGSPTAPNGHNYGMEFTNCKYGVYVAAVSSAGMMFYDYKFTDCDFGFYLADRPGGVIQIQGCEFDTKTASVYAPTTNNTKLLLNQNTINSGPVDVRGGLVSIVNCDFNNDPNQIILGPNVSAIVTGNHFSKEVDIKNVSLYKCIIDNDSIEMTTLPQFPYKNQYDFVQKPSGSAFYVGDASNGITVTSDDNSDALQTLLDQAKTKGGGIVFLPPGHYNFRKPITIPTGVELKGSVDVPCLPMGPGSAMEIYAGKDDEDGTPFITMEPGSGIRGLVMDYPEQVIQLLTQPDRNGGDVYHYPYCIQGNKDVYIVNIGLRACYNGVDLFTNKCDNHFVDYLAGHVFRNGIRVGGGSTGGHIYNSQFNQIAYASGGETKFGAWPNSPSNINNPNQDLEYAAAYAYSWNYLEFIVLENCEDQVMYNNFVYGSNRGFTLTEGAQGISLGQGTDASMKAFYIRDVGEKGFNLINTQIVTTAPDPGNFGLVLQEYKNNNRYIQVDPNFTKKVTFFAADFWGQPQNISNDVQSGTLEMQCGNYDNPGQKNFASVTPNAAFDIIGTNINNIGSLLTSGSAPQFFIQSSLVDAGNLNTGTVGLWLNNLGHTPVVDPNGIDREGWIATASVYNDDAQKALDGDLTTRWSTMSYQQKPGQWFMVDMLENQTFTGIYMDPDMTSGYTPVEFTVYVSTDGVNWTAVASGRNTPLSLFDKQTARYIKVEQTGTGTSAWRIAEFNVVNTELPSPNSIKNIVNREEVSIWSSFDQLNLSGLTGTSTVKIYSLTGQAVTPAFSINESASVNLPTGIYIAVIQNNGNVYKKKFIKN